MVISRIIYGFIVNFEPVLDNGYIVGYRILDDQTEKLVGHMSLEEYRTGYFCGLEFGPYQQSRVRHWFGHVQCSASLSSFDHPTQFVPESIIPSVVAVASTIKLVPKWYLLIEDCGNVPDITCNSAVLSPFS